MDKLDEKDEEIKMLHEKILVASVALSEYRLGEEVAIAKRATSSAVVADTNLLHPPLANATSADVP